MTTSQENFVDAVKQRFGWDEQFQQALDYATESRHSDKDRPHSIDVARRVIDMGSDRDTVIATLLTEPGLRATSMLCGLSLSLCLDSVA